MSVIIDKGYRNSRRLYASVEIAAPLQVVWEALTDYEGLGTFIPGGKLARGVRSAGVAEMLYLVQWRPDVTRQLTAALLRLNFDLRSLSECHHASLRKRPELQLAC